MARALARGILEDHTARTIAALKALIDEEETWDASAAWRPAGRYLPRTRPASPENLTV